MLRIAPVGLTHDRNRQNGKRSIIFKDPDTNGNGENPKFGVLHKFLQQLQFSEILWHRTPVTRFVTPLPMTPDGKHSHEDAITNAVTGKHMHAHNEATLPTEAACGPQAAGTPQCVCTTADTGLLDSVLLTARQLSVALLASRGTAEVVKAVTALVGPLEDGTEWPATGGAPHHHPNHNQPDHVILLKSVLFDAHLQAGSVGHARTIHESITESAHDKSAHLNSTHQSPARLSPTGTMVQQRMELLLLLVSGTGPKGFAGSSCQADIIQKISTLETNSINERLDLLERARCSLAIGRAWHLLGQRVNASAWLATSALLFDRAGQHAWVGQVRNESSMLAVTSAKPVATVTTYLAEPTATTALTDREREMARLIRLGHTNREIAASLHVSVKTVEATLSGTYRRLGIRGRQQLAVAIPA